jgi:hypothetical protein
MSTRGVCPTVTLQEVEAGGQELKRAMKEAADSEYVVSQKLAYEKRARQDLEVNLEVALKSLQNCQVTIAGYEVELNDLKRLCPHLLSGRMLSRTGPYPQSQAGKIGTGGFLQTRVLGPKIGIPSALLSAWSYLWLRPPRMKTS